MFDNKRISIEEFEAAMKDIYMPTVEINWNGLPLIIKKNISLEETMNFVEYVTELCFSETTHTYMPEVRDFAIKMFLIEHYTNIDLPQDIEKKYEFVYSTDIFQTVINNIDPYQFNEIIHSIDTKLDYMADANIEAFNNQVAEVAKLIEQFGTLFSDAFDGVDSDTISKLVNSISDVGFDEEKLVKAYISQTKSNEEENESQK